MQFYFLSLKLSQPEDSKVTFYGLLMKKVSSSKRLVGGISLSVLSKNKTSELALPK